MRALFATESACMLSATLSQQPRIFELDGPPQIKVGWKPHARKGEPIISLPPPASYLANGGTAPGSGALAAAPATANPVSGAKQTPGPAMA